MNENGLVALQSAREKDQLIEELRRALEQCRPEPRDDRSPVTV